MRAYSDATFDRIAPEYDRLWSSTAVGTRQRSAFWKIIDPLFGAGDRVLDLGCGTGVDALHLEAAGVHVYGIDSSSEMITIAQERGIDAHLLAIERVGKLRTEFHGAISNFGALNCVSRLDQVALALARLIRGGGRVALCFFGRVCAWEIAYHLSRGKMTKAFRRFRGHVHSELSRDVFYYSSSFIVSTFEPYFRLQQRLGIGLFVPPSYVGSLSERLVSSLSTVDSLLADKPILRELSDHALYIFERL